MQTGFAVCAFISLILNLIIPEESEAEDVLDTQAKEAELSSNNGSFGGMVQHKMDPIEGEHSQPEKGRSMSIGGRT